jgi:hypothetical protein
LKANDVMRPFDSDALIDALADDLRPVRHQRQSMGMTMVLIGWAVSAVLLLSSVGLRADIREGMLPPMALLQLFWAAGLAIIAQWFAVRMAMPGVGRDHSGWHWAALVALALPLAALVSLVASPTSAWDASQPHAGLDCLWQGLAAGAAVAAVLTLWLRQGAPTSPARAGLVTGIAAGATGVAVVALHCPVDALMHIGLWHAATILLSAVAGRLLLPQLLRW